MPRIAQNLKYKVAPNGERVYIWTCPVCDHVTESPGKGPTKKVHLGFHECGECQTTSRLDYLNAVHIKQKELRFGEEF